MNREENWQLVCNVGVILFLLYSCVSLLLVPFDAGATTPPRSTATPTALPALRSLTEPGAPVGASVTHDGQMVTIRWEQMSQANTVLLYRCEPCTFLAGWYDTESGPKRASDAPVTEGSSYTVGEFVTSEGGVAILGYYELGTVPWMTWMPEVYR